MVSLSYSKVGETIRNVIHKITNLLLLKNRRERIFFVVKRNKWNCAYMTNDKEWKKFELIIFIFRETFQARMPACNLTTRDLLCLMVSKERTKKLLLHFNDTFCITFKTIISFKNASKCTELNFIQISLLQLNPSSFFV